MRLSTATAFVFALASAAVAQRPGASKVVADHPQAVGDPGIAWYTTWDSGLEEARRSKRPIFFMAASTTGRGVSGCF